MKKKLSILALFAYTLLFGLCNNVQAAEMKVSEVPNNTYIIGTHMFTDEVVLSTRHIMLGATTIKSDKLSDMTIYYKTPRGAWIDGLSGDAVTVPTSFDVDYIDTVLQITTPTISSNEEVSNTEDTHGKIYNLVLTGIENMTGVELYSSSTENGEYTLVRDYKVSDINENKIEVEVKGGYNYFYKVKSYTKVTEKTYSEFSNVMNINNSLLQPRHSSGNGGYKPKEGENQNLNRVLLFDENDFNTALGNHPDGIEVYSSLNENGEYTLVSNIAYEDLDVIDDYGTVRVPFDCTPGYKNYIKIRSYLKYGDNTIYSEYRVVIYNDDYVLSSPSMTRLQQLTVNSDHLTYGVDIYIDRIYYSDFQRYPVGVDVLYSTSEDGEYEVLETVALTDMTYSSDANAYIANVNVPVGNKYFIKLRKYVIVNEEKIVGSAYSRIADTEMYSITYDLDGGKFYYQEGKYSLEVFSTSSEFAIAYPRKNGYVFIGWTGSNGDTPQMEVTIKKGTTGNLEYTANWVLLGDVDNNGQLNTSDLVKITTYVHSGNTTDIENILYGDVNLDNEVDDVDTSILAKYLSDAEGYNISLPYNSGEKYTISYNLNEGVLNTSSNIKTYAQISLPYTLKNPEKEGYVFIGWTGSNGDTPQTKVTIEEGTTGNLEYTSNWALYGDVNCDGEVTEDDRVFLSGYIADHEGYVLTEQGKINADVNVDGAVDTLDRLILTRHISGLEGYERLPYIE